MIIYITKNLLNNKKYIGKDSHNNPNYLGSGALLLEDIKKYGKKNFQKEILEICTKENLGEREEYWITYFDAVKSKNFYNIRSQTSGWYNKDLNKEKYDYVTNKISKALIGKSKPKGFGTKISNNQERKNQLSKSNKGKSKPKGFGELISKIKISQNIKFTKEQCDKISQSKLGKKQPQSFLNKKYKPIIQLDKENNILNEFKSIEEASNSNKIFKRSNISCCLIGKSKTAYGYKWIYK
jgi:group I intron endonuclease